MNNVRIAVVVCHAPLNAVDTNLAGLRHWVGKAAANNVRIICFPELNICGYATHPERVTVEAIPGRITVILSSLAKEMQMVILAGMAEKASDGGVHAVQLVARPDGVTDVYRKLHIAPPERRLFVAGNHVPLFDAFGVRFGIQLCYDTHFPELSTVMAMQGAELIFMPHASPRGTSSEKYNSWMRHLPARAYDNGLYVVACNQTGDNGGGLVFPGVSMVIGPDGRILQKDISGQEGMLVAELSLEAFNRVRQHEMRYFFPNRRPALYADAVRGG